MKVLFDLNVLMDVLQKREAFYDASAEALSASLKGKCHGIIPGHAVTTLHYLLTKYTNKSKADESIDFIVDHFEVCSAGNTMLKQARALAMKDFEDAVVASIAAHNQCDFIVSRNISDFTASPVKALLPEEFLDCFE